MWDIVIQNLPTIILVVFAAIICGAELIKAIRVWKDERERNINGRIEEQNQEAATQNAIAELNAKSDAILESLGNIESRMASAEQRLQDLTESDMHDIKAWIVEQYHKFYNNQGWIDAFSAETIDKRYEDYLKEGGNSYVENLIAQLHSLSMDPNQSLRKENKDKK